MNHILATSRPWNEALARRLQEKTGHIFHLINRKEQLSLERLREIAPKYIFFPHWSYIIPEEIYENYESIIFHMTDLPYGRGGSPLQNLIVRGHRETQISALRCVAELDAGPIYFKRPLSLEGAASEIFLRASTIIEEMIINLVTAQPKPVAQEGEATIFRRRLPDESDLTKAPINDIVDIFDFIRMLDADGYPRAFFEVSGYRVELSRVQLEYGKLVGTFTICSEEGIPELRLSKPRI